MPNKNDIIIAVKNSDKFLKIPELREAAVKLKSDGSPYFITGGFTMVFQLEKNSKKWAFRVWHIQGMKNLKERFRKISQHLSTQKLPYFADFIYDEKGLLVNGELVDTIRMEWLNGDLLKDYIEKNLKDKDKLQKLAVNFLKMCEDLHEHKISHGDLQHGNILIDNQDNIRLIDYDSVCVPSIETQEELVTGLKGFQHPSRYAGNTKTSLKTDYFSELVIYLSLLALAQKPQLWDTYKVKTTEVLLFNEEDFKNIKQSAIYSDLKKLNSSSINNLLLVLETYLNEKSYLKLQPYRTNSDIFIVEKVVEKIKIKYVDKIVEKPVIKYVDKIIEKKVTNPLWIFISIALLACLIIFVYKYNESNSNATQTEQIQQQLKRAKSDIQTLDQNINNLKKTIQERDNEIRRLGNALRAATD
jgi:serine/threonine protein kinase